MAETDNSIDARIYGFMVDEQKTRFRCNYCAKEVSSFNHLQSHLGGVREDLKPCMQVPENIRKLREVIHLFLLLVVQAKEMKRHRGRKRKLVDALEDSFTKLESTLMLLILLARRIINATFKEGQVEYDMPNLQELRGSMLDDEFEDMKDHFNNIKDLGQDVTYLSMIGSMRSVNTLLIFWWILGRALIFGPWLAILLP
ncbi:uncharacterized protein LOC119985066 [Tripterygium wilfordii]|uniref:uncharacterized protein LOC119985066 n=1 Tax=Tripterygium wilfordii TaxID=458696 RepID=UPI0018F85F81|nr:uncharacterized protein LOC119985066 [Tripterygium wilfordii]XP_038685162.1 uncharacterized protein LOC119985066 [Tripterygium wilfordii]XP_038685163.1 uncharacterized protein LOC119985066 [Tripterygium wilfordii]